MKKILLLCVLGLGLVLSFQSCSPHYRDQPYRRTVVVRPAVPYYSPAPRVYVQRRPHRWYHRGYRY